MLYQFGKLLADIGLVAGLNQIKQHFAYNKALCRREYIYILYLSCLNLPEVIIMTRDILSCDLTCSRCLAGFVLQLLSLMAPRLSSTLFKKLSRNTACSPCAT